MVSRSAFLLAAIIAAPAAAITTGSASDSSSVITASAHLLAPRLEVMRREPEQNEDAPHGESLAEAEQLIGPPIALVMQSVPTYVPVNGATAPVAASEHQPAVAVPASNWQVPSQPGSPGYPAATPLQAKPAAEKYLAASATADAAAVPLPTSGAALPIATGALAKAAVPSASPIAVSGLTGNLTNSTQDLLRAKQSVTNTVQTRSSAGNVLMFGLSVTIALISSGAIACLIQARSQDKFEPSFEPPVQVVVSRPAAKDAHAVVKSGASNALHERDIHGTPPASTGARVASPEQRTYEESGY
jgi:hypothetical protein